MDRLAQSNVGRTNALCNLQVPVGADCFWHKITFRTPRRPNKKLKLKFEKNCSSYDCRPGHHIPGSDHQQLITIVTPNRRCLELLDELIGFVNSGEAALDLIFATQEGNWSMRKFFDDHFIQNWHGKRESYLFETTAYTGYHLPGVRFVWYSDLPSKVRGAEFCLHIEARYQGVAAMRRLGIHRPSDMIDFDHASLWRRHLNFYQLDLERLGRWHLNRQTHQRRHRPWIKQCGTLSYNVDRRRGSILYRIYAVTDAFAKHCDMVDRREPWDEEQPDQPILDRCLQKFIDTYGRGPFLQRLDIPFDISNTHTGVPYPIDFMRPFVSDRFNTNIDGEVNTEFVSPLRRKGNPAFPSPNRRNRGEHHAT